jgi:hypothetical protein
MAMQQNDEERAEILRRDGAMIGIAVLSLLNGMNFSPFFDPFLILLKPIAAGFFISSPLLVLYFTSLLLSAITLILGGAVAAIFERITGRTETDFASMLVWLGATFVLALPSLLGSVS